MKKYDKKINILSVILAFLLVTVFVQAYFNVVMWRTLHDMSLQTSSIAIASTFEGMRNQMPSPDAQNRIPEARLQLSDTDQIEILYAYVEGDDDISSFAEVTTQDIYSLGLNYIGGKNQEELFDRAMNAQACKRGFTLSFDESYSPSTDGTLGQNLAASKVLSDGRTMNVWRENGCGDKNAELGSDEHNISEKMDALENYILSTDSY